MPMKPTLGYPSRTDAVLGLRQDGFSTAAIAAKLGVKVSTIYALECSSQRPKRMLRETEAMGRTIVIPIDVLDELQPHAARRGIHVNKLVRLIVEQVADENMVDAVLDDAEVAA